MTNKMHPPHGNHIKVNLHMTRAKLSFTDLMSFSRSSSQYFLLTKREKYISVAKMSNSQIQIRLDAVEQQDKLF